MGLLEDRLYERTGPKRILALDGGGVRGALSLAYLARIEELLAARHANPGAFRLADYFDLIGGTSTGAVIAACLAKGDSVAEIQGLYQRLAGDVFVKPFWRFGVLVPKYRSERLREVLDRHFGDLTLGSPELRTGLVVVTKRLDTSSQWPLMNLPRGRYFALRPESNAIPNRDYGLAQVVRASTAAPHYFDDEPIEITSMLTGRFIDGGVSTANNPGLLMFLVATLDGYSLGWPTGVDQLLLVSVGTGSAPAEINTRGLVRRRAAIAAARALVTMMTDADALNQTVLQALADSPTPQRIDREIGDLRDDQLGGAALLTYVRYNVELERGWLHREIGFEAEPERIEKLRRMDDPTSVEDLETVGAHAARQQVQDAHFPAAFDPPPDHAG
jgi:uncharacterized protein